MLLISGRVRVHIQFTVGAGFGQFGLHLSARLRGVIRRGADAVGGNRRVRIPIQFAVGAGPAPCPL
ncbi:hypothetical protein GGD41_005239 [Paraburkholderia bryophila]|uniref:Uncharacterized protein n=1 Tax=Paraburkholderia bryophila TaxID=420952 RepID=A0A7Y9WC20_9BURK|nr:hypothetical protein [Paraburkholderia bryophila]